MTLKNYYNYNYVGTILIGTPPRKVRAIFDTGSTNQWVLSSMCDSVGCKNGDNYVYDPQASSTFIPTDIGVEIEFGSGPLEGFFGFDDVWVGGGQQRSELIHVVKQSFGIVTQESVFDDTFDAIIGLAYPAMGEGVGTALFDSMMSQKLLKQNVFAFYMSMNEEEPSELIFGWIDEEKYEGEMKWYKVINKLFWSLKLDDILVSARLPNSYLLAQWGVLGSLRK